MIANLSLHWVNDLVGTLIQLRARPLRPDGLLLASMPVLGTLAELRAALTEAEAGLTGGASPRVSPFPTLPDSAALLQRAGFSLPVVDADSLTPAVCRPVRDPAGVAGGRGGQRRHRSATGAVPGRALFPAALAQMPQRDGRVPVTLRLAMMTGWAPGPTQPKPAVRGSATVSLADALR